MLVESLVADTIFAERREGVLFGGVFSVKEPAEDNFFDLEWTPLFRRFVQDFPVLSDESLAELLGWGVLTLVERANEDMEDEDPGKVLRVPLETGILDSEAASAGEYQII